jgi:hypothetical protein
MIVTPLRGSGGPLYPVHCPICGQFLGSLYRDGRTLKMFAKRCSERCVRLWEYGRGHPRWRSLPPHLRQVWLAAGLLNHETQTIH